MLQGDAECYGEMHGSSRKMLQLLWVMHGCLRETSVFLGRCFVAPVECLVALQWCLGAPERCLCDTARTLGAQSDVGISWKFLKCPWMMLVE